MLKKERRSRAAPFYFLRTAFAVLGADLPRNGL